MLPLKRNILLNFVSGRDASTPGELTLMIEKLKENENYLIEQGCRTLDSDDSQFDNYGWPRCDTGNFITCRKCRVLQNSQNIKCLQNLRKLQDL